MSNVSYSSIEQNSNWVEVVLCTPKRKITDDTALVTSDSIGVKNFTEF